MINNTTVKEGFQGLIGVRPTGANLPDIDSDLTDTDSEYYFQDLHVLLKDEYIYNSAIPYDNATDEQLSEYYRQKLDSAYLESVRSVVNRKLANKAGGHTVLAKTQLYLARSRGDEIQKRGRFVGFQVKLKSPGTRLRIDNISLHLTQAQNNVPIYFYQVNTLTGTVKQVNVTTPGSMQSFEVKESKIVDLTGSQFIVGYYENDLTGQAIRTDINLVSMHGCPVCNLSEYTNFNQWTKYFTVAPFFVENEFLDGDELAWSDDQQVVISNTNFGMNMGFSVVCDISDDIVDNRYLFTDLVKAQLVLSVMQDLAGSLRMNATNTYIQNYIANDGGPRVFMRDQQRTVNSLIEIVSGDITTINFSCLPHNFKKTKVKMSTI